MIGRKIHAQNKDLYNVSYFVNKLANRIYPSTFSLGGECKNSHDSLCVIKCLQREDHYTPHIQSSFKGSKLVQVDLRMKFARNDEWIPAEQRSRNIGYLRSSASLRRDTNRHNITTSTTTKKQPNCTWRTTHMIKTSNGNVSILVFVDKNQTSEEVLDKYSNQLHCLYSCDLNLVKKYSHLEDLPATVYVCRQAFINEANKSDPHGLALIEENRNASDQEWRERDLHSYIGTSGEPRD
ncbi:hypothetical protein PO909_004405 [Leuciscus waleckii]